MCSHHLIHELCRLEPEADDRDAQRHRTLESDRVLPQSVVKWGQTPRVLSAVDLDVQPDVFPQDIEIHAAMWATAYSLAGWLRKSPAAAQRGKVELA
ncbi:hypothetical protein BH23ACT6_BH23ACT6_04860 [soil metagenome]